MKQLWSKPEYHLKLSKIFKNNWNDPVFASMMGKAWRIHPNKPEKLLLNILNEMFPNEWKYTGDFSFSLNGKSPDFTNINGQKKVIELFGDYWHKGENPKERINMFHKFGFETLVIWENELKNIKRVKFRLNRFYRMAHYR